ncbi:hypothetical protein [Erwinia sp. 198]|uniref:hypothetical protein n=1 Tax=Erwinia sp. 198 TaxID=2022746 RepID=UPI000F686F8B|nr:hypothetical protein [Erwinia sp. 198]RRZ87229.1 hypothetical protein EGK14_19730 [Erwinia sp. 198]
MSTFPAAEAESNQSGNTRPALREQRLQELLESCQNHILQQLIGPFGLNTAMFADSDGGNVTTTHNFEKGVVATDSDKARYEAWSETNSGGYNRKPYDKELPGKRKDMFMKDEPVISAYTGNELKRDGTTHLDHVVSANRIEIDSRNNLFMTQAQRVAMANDPKNLVAAESNINQSMQEIEKNKWADKVRKNNKGQGLSNTEYFGIDREKLAQTASTAEAHVKKDVLIAQVKKQGAELAKAGAQQAMTSALRQALGVALHTLVNHTFIELKRLFNDPDKSNLIDRLTAALKRVVNQVLSKLRAMWDAAVNGLLQGFISNLLTFLINNFITTAAKVVSVIREGMTGLWKAIKMLINPPPGQTGIETARAVTKILAGVVTTSLGLMFEEAIKGFLSGIPLLLPMVGILSPAITAILTGIVSSLVVYGLDRFFDWLSQTGTERLKAMEVGLDANKENMGKMAQWLELQFQNSASYRMIGADYQLIESHLKSASNSQNDAAASQRTRIQANQQFNQQLDTNIDSLGAAEADVMLLLENYLAKDPL